MLRRRLGILVVAALLLFNYYAFSELPGSIAEEVKRHCSNVPFNMPEVRVPIFPDRTVSIIDFGAVADGQTLNTSAFAEAIEACATAGGGTVRVPPGTWMTGPIKLVSGINLHLERGALVQFSRRIEDFPLIAGLDGRSRRYVVTPPIYACGARNIALTGEGVFDGAGEVWRYVKKSKLTSTQWKQLVASGGVVSPDDTEWWPSKEALEGERYIERLESSGGTPTAADYGKAREYLRPDLFRPVQCDGVLLDGPTFRNSPRFHVHPVQCENLIVRDVKILAEWYTQNGDGLDLSSCRSVVVYGTTVNVGDDGICIKPAGIAPSQKPGPACENIVIADCIVYHAHGGFVIGSESYGGARNILVRNCLFLGTDVGIRCKSARGRGGLVENIFVDGVQMRGIQSEAVLFDMQYGGGAPDAEAVKNPARTQALPVTDRTPRFQNFSLKNIVCNGASRAIVVNGLPEMPVRDITFDNVSLSADQGVVCTDAEGIMLNRCMVEARSGPAVTLIESRDITLRGGLFSGPSQVFIRVEGETSEKIRILGIDPAHTQGVVELGKTVKRDAVKRDADGLRSK